MGLYFHFLKNEGFRVARFTSTEWIMRLMAWDIPISMDSRGWALDNVFVERLWRTLKYQNIYLRGYDSPAAVVRGLASYIDFYKPLRIRSMLGYLPPNVYEQETTDDPPTAVSQSV